jgi:hypothetical protein
MSHLISLLDVSDEPATRSSETSVYSQVTTMHHSPVTVARTAYLTPREVRLDF